MRCTHWHHLPTGLAKKARRMAPDDPLDRAVQCHLSAHEGDEHYGLLAELGQYGTALWLRWHGSDVDVAVLPDCPVIGTGSGSGGDACCLFAGHVERHSWEDTPPQ
ncbi:hypothetical protein OH797_18625 [Streptomyces anulatus]|nr:hypothetical protein OHQ35_18520 [Streptomyces anulatus]